FVGDNAALTAGGIVRVDSTTHDDIESVSAAQAFSTGAGQPTRLYKNGGATPFTPATAPKSVTDPDQRVTSMALGDIDKDGDLDLVTCNFAQFNKVYRNDGAGNFDAGTNVCFSFNALVQKTDRPNREARTSA